MAEKKPSRPRRAPARTPEAREKQLIALAVDVAEEQMRSGKASAQVITHFLKLGTAQAELEKEKLILDNEYRKAQTKALAGTEEIKALYANAIDAIRRYSGQSGVDDYDD